ncbi:stalk domain-containing protein [Massilibacterium senegalense]|uniref:stalk domain-containing protein n=1 Tax=Massilibacterium senegalense TaxID=1632858 RepID=UPI00078293F7|nr:stalk domain-containing protein [Massilibacterium senegalense]
MTRKLKILTIMMVTTFLTIPVFLLSKTLVPVVKADDDRYEQDFDDEYEDDKYEKEDDDDDDYKRNTQRTNQPTNTIVKQTVTVSKLDGNTTEIEALKQGNDDWYVPATALKDVLGATVVDYPDSQISEIIFKDDKGKLQHLIVKANTNVLYLNGDAITDDEIPTFNDQMLYIPTDLLDDYLPLDVKETNNSITFKKEGIL